MLPTDQIAISTPASSGRPCSRANAGIAISIAPNAKPTGSIESTSVWMPGERSAPRRPSAGASTSPARAGSAGDGGDSERRGGVDRDHERRREQRADEEDQLRQDRVDRERAADQRGVAA